MKRYEFATVDVFTHRQFGGNPLAVFLDAVGLTDGEMQSLASEMNYSETTFVLPPEDPANTARVRIFNRTAEMPFAGHPNVGTAYALAKKFGGRPDYFRFEEQAGLVRIKLSYTEGNDLDGAEIEAPQAVSCLGYLPPDGIAACLSLSTEDIVLTTHKPVRASVGVDFVLVEVKPEAVGLASPDLPAYRALEIAANYPSQRLSILLYARDSHDIRARMFAPLAGTWEDPATGSANAALCAYLLSLGSEVESRFVVTQGVEMGRPSQILINAYRSSDGIRAKVRGRCVSVFKGSYER